MHSASGRKPGRMVAVKTAMSRREKIMDKLNLQGRIDLIRFALKFGVIRV